MHTYDAAARRFCSAALLCFFRGKKPSNEASIKGFRGVFHESEGLLNNLLTLDALIAIKTGSDSVVFAAV